jgi:hypothetical protein
LQKNYIQYKNPELSFDISDLEGDRAGGCKTLPYLSVVFGITDVLLLYYIYLLKQSKTRIDYIRQADFCGFIMILGLVGLQLQQ